MSFFAFAFGLVALAGETVWWRAVGRLLGGTAAAPVVILAVTLGGIAAGSALGERRARHSRRPSRALAAAATVLVAAALATGPCLAAIERVAETVALSPRGGPMLAAGVRYAAAGAFLLVPALALGAALALLAARSSPVPRLGGMLSATLAGGAAGVALASYLGLALAGERASLGLVATLGAILAGASWLAGDRTASAAGTGWSAGAGRARGALSFLAGFAALGSTASWARVLALGLGPRVYVGVELVVVALAGLAAGAPLARAAGARPRAGLAGALTAAGVTLGVEALVLAGAGGRLSALAASLRLAGFARQQLVLGAAVAAVVLPAALALGVGLALASQPRVAGAAAALGALAAALAVPLALIPLLGVQRLILALALGCAAAGAGEARSRGARVAGAAIGALLLVEAVALPARALPAAVAGGRAAGVEEVGERVAGTVVVRWHDDPRGAWRSVELDGAPVAGTPPGLAAAELFRGHLALLLAPHPDTVLVIGLGSGATTWAVSRHPVRRIVVAEPSADLVARAGTLFGAVNHGVLADPRVALVREEGRGYLRDARERFDVILAEAGDPSAAGNGGSYTREYFALCRRHLRAGGVVSVRLPMAALDEDSYLAVLRAFWEVFPDACVWVDPLALDDVTVLTGTERPGELDARWSAFAAPGLRDALAQAGITDAAAFGRALLLGPREVAALADEVSPHLDDLPEAEFRAGRSLDREGAWLANFRTLWASRARACPFAGFPGRWEEATAARDAAVRAQIRELSARTRVR